VGAATQALLRLCPSLIFQSNQIHVGFPALCSLAKVNKEKVANLPALPSSLFSPAALHPTDGINKHQTEATFVKKNCIEVKRSKTTFHCHLG
jgi:hypothetical protein